MELKEKLCDLFESDETPKTPKIKLKEKIGASETELVNQLADIQSATVHFDLFTAISSTAQEKRVNLYVFRRVRVGIHYSPKNRYYYAIVACKAGIPKANHLREQTGIVAKIDAFPRQVNHRRSSRQYKLLKAFEQAIAVQEGI